VEENKDVEIYQKTLEKIRKLVMELIMKNCKQCEKEFQPKDELDQFCSQDCKEEALAELDSGSDECLSCQ
jgi:activator of HSP90 ATPase